MGDAGKCVNTSDERLNISRGSTELVKYIDALASNARDVRINVTIDKMHGDMYCGNSRNMSAGHNNTYNSGISYTAHSPGSVGSVDLSNTDSIYDYMEKNTNTPEFAFLITLAIFNGCQFDLVIREAQFLYDKYISQDTIHDKNTSVKESFDIHKNRMIKLFEVQYFKVEEKGESLIPVEYVKFSSEQHALNVLECMLEGTTKLQNLVVDFLIYLLSSEYVAQYINALNTIKKIIKFIPESLLKKIIRVLIENKTVSSDLAIAHILYSLLSIYGAKYDVDMYLQDFFHENKNIHYHLTALTLCKLLHCKRDVIANEFSPVLDALINQPQLEIILEQINIELPEEENYINNISVFYNIGNRYSEYYIALVGELSKRLRNTNRWDRQRKLILLITFLFFSEDFNESCVDSEDDSSSFNDMVFIRLALRSEAEVRNNIIFLWGELIKSNLFGTRCKSLLKNYLLKREGNIKDDMEQRKLNKFFRSFSYDSYAYKIINNFLNKLTVQKNAPTELAAKILNGIGGR